MVTAVASPSSPSSAMIADAGIAATIAAAIMMLSHLFFMLFLLIFTFFLFPVPFARTPDARKTFVRLVTTLSGASLSGSVRIAVLLL